MAKRLSRIERDIERLKEKISEYQQQLKELEAAKTEQENLQIIQLVRSMNMKPDEFAAFLRSGALNAALNVKPGTNEVNRFILKMMDEYVKEGLKMELSDEVYESYGTYLRDLKVTGHTVLINTFEDFIENMR